MWKPTDELYHYGVKGQKWGIRKEEEPRQKNNSTTIKDDYDKIVTELDDEGLKLVKKFPDLQLTYDDGDYDNMLVTAKHYGADTTKFEKLLTKFKTVDEQYWKQKKMNLILLQHQHQNLIEMFRM